MFRRFYPAEMAESSYDIDYEELYRKGYRGLIYDIDNLITVTKESHEEIHRLYAIKKSDALARIRGRAAEKGAENA